MLHTDVCKSSREKVKLNNYMTTSEQKLFTVDCCRQKNTHV